MTPGVIVPAGSQVVQPGQVHKPTLQLILGFLPAILEALQSAAAINAEVGHETIAQIVTDSITAGAKVAGDIPESHVQTVGAIISAVAPNVVAAIRAAQNVRKA